MMGGRVSWSNAIVGRMACQAAGRLIEYDGPLSRAAIVGRDRLVQQNLNWDLVDVSKYWGFAGGLFRRYRFGDRG